MTFEIPANATPSTPVTYEWLTDYMESQAQETTAVNAAINSIATGFPGPAAQGYLGWSAPVWAATSTASLTSTAISMPHIPRRMTRFPRVFQVPSCRQVTPHVSRCRKRPGQTPCGMLSLV